MSTSNTNTFSVSNGYTTLSFNLFKEALKAYSEFKSNAETEVFTRKNNRSLNSWENEITLSKNVLNAENEIVDFKTIYSKTISYSSK